MGPMARVRVEDQLGIGQVLLKDERVDGGDHDVVAAVHDQDRLAELLEVGVAVPVRLPPFTGRGPVRPGGLGRHRRVPVLAGPDTGQVPAASFLAGRRR